MNIPPEQIKAAVAEIRWFHTIDLGNGIITPGMVDYRNKMDYFKIPNRLDKKIVLDVGAWDGFFSFECERRGAGYVLATDSWCWGGGGWGTQDGFNLARKTLGSKVADLKIDVLDLHLGGVFDLVLFLGVLYHMKHPLLALEKIFGQTACGGMAIIETHLDLPAVKYPAMRFYPGKELNNDPSNWWGPNPQAVMAMLECVGFKKVRQVSEVQSRGVFHAWREQEEKRDA